MLALLTVFMSVCCVLKGYKRNQLKRKSKSKYKVVLLGLVTCSDTDSTSALLCFFFFLIVVTEVIMKPNNFLFFKRDGVALPKKKKKKREMHKHIRKPPA